jgi:GDPmannose 4,6-dehydratase
MRRSSTFSKDRIDHIYKDPHDRNSKLFLHYGDLADASFLDKIISELKPDEIYNLAAQSHVQVSFENPVYTADITGLGTLRILEAIRNFSPNTKFYQASSSEMFGMVLETPQTETTPFNPQSPYGCAKVFSYFITKNYRESYKLQTYNGILFNHESPRRGRTFVTRKITRAVARIKLGIQDKLYLGNLSSKRDWGYAKDYIKAMWLMVQKDPNDYVIATNETHTVREFVELAFNEVGMKITWSGSGINEVGKCNNKIVVKVDERYFRPSEVDILIGNYKKAFKDLGWKPSINLQELIAMMIKFDLENEAKDSSHKSY